MWLRGHCTHFLLGFYAEEGWIILVSLPAWPLSGCLFVCLEALQAYHFHLFSRKLVPLVRDWPGPLPLFLPEKRLVRYDYQAMISAHSAVHKMWLEQMAQNFCAGAHPRATPYPCLSACPQSLGFAQEHPLFRHADGSNMAMSWTFGALSVKGNTTTHLNICLLVFCTVHLIVIKRNPEWSGPEKAITTYLGQLSKRME